MAEYKVGERLRSRVSSVSLVVVRVDRLDIEITCGGESVARSGDELTTSAVAADGPAIEMGKRYEDPDGTVEVLCVAAGAGELAVNGTPLQLKTPRPLPASD